VTLRRLTSGAFLVAMLAACSSGGAPIAAVTPTPPVQASPQASTSPVVSPSPIASPSPPRLVIPRPTVPFVRCDTKDLEMRLIFIGAAAGNVGGLIEVRNKSSRNCDLYGYAGLQLLDARGRPLPTGVIWSDSSYIFGANLVTAVIGLPAGTIQITPQRPVPGHAYIPISWGDVQAPCSSAAKLRVTPPDAFTSLVISAIPPGSGSGLTIFCSGVIVNPTRAAFYR
jgi:hypothetical protein